MTDATPPAPRDFAAFFAAEIAPGLPALEEQRRDRLRASTTRAVGLAFVVVTAALIAWLAWHVVAGAVLLVAGAAIGLVWVRRPARQHRAAVRDLVIPPLCRYLGNVDYHRDPKGRFDLDRVRRSSVVAPFTRAKLEDLFLGRYRDTDFRMVEARLVRKRETGQQGDGGGARRRTVFAGLLCEVSVPVAFNGGVLLIDTAEPRAEQLAGVLKRRSPGAEVVAFDDAAFATRYRVFSDAPAEARRLLQPGLRESLLALAEDLAKDRSGKPVNCAFLEGYFLMAIPQDRNFFEIGRLARSLAHAEEDLRQLAAEFTIPQRLIDNLHGERKPLLPQD